MAVAPFDFWLLFPALMNIFQDNRIDIGITITDIMGSSINLEHRLGA